MNSMTGFDDKRRTGAVHILIVHGWMHSAKRYLSLKEALESQGNVEVTLYEFPGFGETPAKYRKQILKHYTHDMKQHLRKNKYDFVIAHSMGGNVVLKAAAVIRPECHLILMNPEYMGIPCLRLLLPVFPLVFLGLRITKYRCRLNNCLIKLAALLTINRWQLIDEIIIEDARRADCVTAARLLFELAFDRFRINKNIRPPHRTILFISENDRIIPFKHMKRLYQDLGNGEILLFRGIGHTIVAEAFENLAEEILVRI